MNAIITVIGVDQVGILAAVSNECAKYNCNIIDVNQSVLNNTFAMVMMVNIDKLSISLSEFIDNMKIKGNEKNLQINVMHEDIFNSMHKI